MGMTTLGYGSALGANVNRRNTTARRGDRIDADVIDATWQEVAPEAANRPDVPLLGPPQPDVKNGEEQP